MAEIDLKKVLDLNGLKTLWSIIDNKKQDQEIYFEGKKLTIEQTLQLIKNSLKNYVPQNRTIAGLDLQKNIEAEELATAINDYLSSSEGEIDLSNYVEKTTTIAGVDLKDDITTDELLDSLSIYPLIELPRAPRMNEQELDVAGKVGQIGYVKISDGNIGDYYRCLSVTKHPQYAGEYIYEWELINSSNLAYLPHSFDPTINTQYNNYPRGYMVYSDGATKVLWVHAYQSVWFKIPLFQDLDNKVDKSTTIAGLSLEKDIITKELQNSLETYPVLILQNYQQPTSATKGEIGQLALYQKYYNTGDGGGSYCWNLAVCISNANSNYIWQSLDFIPSNRKIAGISGDSINVSILANALDEYLSVGASGKNLTNFYESGHFKTASVWTEVNRTHYLEGDYNLIGKMCHLNVGMTAYSGWKDIFFDLPVSPDLTAASYSIQYIMASDRTLCYATIDKNSNRLKISRVDGGAFGSPEPEIHFTFVYQYD